MTTSSRGKFDLDFSAVHQSILPADVRDYDRVVARVKLRDGPGAFVQARVWRLSPLGVELVSSPDTAELEKGVPVDLELTIAGQRTYFEGLIVDLVRENEHIRLIGIRLAAKKELATTNQEKRRSVRWLCSDDYFPTCVSPTPGRYNEYTYFQIRDISREGFQLLCSLRNKYLIPGVQLQLTASFPLVGDVSLSVRITRIDVTSERGKDYLVVGTEFLSLTIAAKIIIGQYLLQFSDADSLQELRNAGFLPNSISKGTDFYFLKSESDFNSILALRHLAHTEAGTVEAGTEAVDMADRFDLNSRIVVGKHKGRVIATIRVRFNVLEEPMEHEQYVDWASNLPRRDQIIELSRACTHPDFRSNDLLASLLRFMATTCLQPQRPWILISTVDELRDFYNKVGLPDTGLSYEHPHYLGEQHVLMGNAYDMLLGRSSHPVYWNVVWRDVLDYLVDTGMIHPEPMDRARLRIYRMIFPFAALMFRLKRRRRVKAAAG